MPAGTATKADRDLVPGGRRVPPAGPADKPPTAKRAKPAKRRRAPLWAKLLTTFGVVLALVSVGGIVGARHFLNKLTENIQTTSSVLEDKKVGGADSTGKLPDGAMNLLMLGLDTRQGWEQAGKTSRSDTILILHITKSHDQAYMISIPRDMVARIPADASMNFNGSTEKINAAYSYGAMNGRGWAGGAKLATKAVNELTGIKFDGVMVIDFSGFQGIIQAMGGLRLCIDKDMWSSHYVVNKGKVEYAEGADPKSPPRNALWFRKGCRQMAPWEALEFSRLRHSTNGDYDRQRHQQLLLRAMAKKASSAGILTNPSKVSKIMAAAGNSLKMDTNGVPVNDFIFGLKGLAAADLISIKTNNGTYAASSEGDGEGVSPDTKAMFEAASADKLQEFLGQHPEMLNNEAGVA